MTDKEELYHFMENVLLLQLGERNELVYEARQTGALVQTALKGYRRIVLLINSASEFMEAVYSEEEQGTVIGTNPTAGTKVSKDTEITMQVSKGSEKITVPNVVGKTESEAKSAITGAGLTVSTVETEYNENYSEGQVIRQDPASGKVEKGTSVSLVVSLGKKPETKLTVPNVVNVSEASARQMISNAGLTVSDTTYISSDTVAAGCVHQL